MPRKPAKPQAPSASLDFSALVESIRLVHEHSTTAARRAVNLSLTLRNWVIGWYIREYEQGGSDRAAYGAALLERLAERLDGSGIDCISPRYLRLCRQFATFYPAIRRALTAKFDHALLPEPIWRSLTAKFDAPGQADDHELNPRHLLERLTFTHFEQLIAIDDPLKRAFYEIECIRGNWSVRALKRQIASLYFERSGLSLDKEKLSAMTHELAETAEPKLSILDPYIFGKQMMREGDNPPIGLLLCTGKDHALVEYALSGMNQPLFVSKYQLELPSKDALQQFIDQKRKEVTGEI